MTTEASLFKMNLMPQKVREQLRKHRWGWKSRGAVFGLGLGLLSPIAGSILTATAWLTGAHWHGFFIQRYGTFLFFLTIPFLIFGAHCLDLMDRDDDAKRRQSNVKRGKSLRGDSDNGRKGSANSEF
jgi:hypothetical protein